MDFEETFENFMKHKKELKVISVASCDTSGKPNSAAKMLVDITKPNKVFFLDYRFTQTFKNITANPKLSVSFLDDDSFTGYRLTGTAEILYSDVDFEMAKKSWEKRLIGYEADRIVKRLKGQYSTKEAEMSLPKDFVIVEFLADEAAVIKPDRVLRMTHGMTP